MSVQGLLHDPKLIILDESTSVLDPLMQKRFFYLLLDEQKKERQSIFFSYLTLCGAIQGMNIGTSIVSKEVRDKTAEFLFVKPVRGIRLFSSKLLAALVNSIMLTIITGICRYYYYDCDGGHVYLTIATFSHLNCIYLLQLI